MNGAESVIATLWDAGVNVCFANPGTSEMQLVAALDKHDDMRAILCLFEGVATGAADGYGRMADKPAATLLHLGPGFGNGWANLHNARRARSAIVNIVGEHATKHQKYDAPLSSDIGAIARAVSGWVKTTASTGELGECAAAAVAAAGSFPGEIATLIIPADHAWDPSGKPATPRAPAAARRFAEAAMDKASKALASGEPAALFLGGRALRADALDQAGRISAATGARLISETFPARLQRGVGRVPVERLPYFGEMAAEFLQGLKHIIFVGAKPPVSFFAYPGKPSVLCPDDAAQFVLAEPDQDAGVALKGVADCLGAPDSHDKAQAPFIPPAPSGKLDAAGVGAILAEMIPGDAIVSDEAATAGLALFPLTAGAAPHDWMTLTGGSIGQGLPLGLGAAVACPDRKVICLQADGGAMYTVQALWTMARENLDVVTVIMNNGSYAILNIELQRVGVAAPGPKALSLLDLTDPPIDWVALSQGMGVRAVRAETVEAFRDAFADAVRASGPRLVEALITP